mmetsp:Transcript_91067/g.281638  ORF Transcript_91067/g.281638 Transcript_91067/m.281638 type:complete len:260 (+) Transcript_91067:285-1064(+)
MRPIVTSATFCSLSAPPAGGAAAPQRPGPPGALQAAGAMGPPGSQTTVPRPLKPRWSADHGGGGDVPRAGPEAVRPSSGGGPSTTSGSANISSSKGACAKAPRLRLRLQQPHDASAPPPGQPAKSPLARAAATAVGSGDVVLVCRSASRDDARIMVRGVGGNTSLWGGCSTGCRGWPELPAGASQVPPPSRPFREAMDANKPQQTAVPTLARSVRVRGNGKLQTPGTGPESDPSATLSTTVTPTAHAHHRAVRKTTIPA